MIGIDSIIIMIVVGAIAGWLAGQIVRGSGLGLMWNIIVGIIGAFIARLAADHARTSCPSWASSARSSTRPSVRSCCS